MQAHILDADLSRDTDSNHRQSFTSSLGIVRIRLDGSGVVLDAEGLAASANCPSCQTSSSCVHARYIRRPMDLPWRGRKARLRVTVRRFHCVNDACPRCTFAEDFGPNLPRLARRTKEAANLLLEMALSLGGEEGARRCSGVGLPVSPDTLLRLIRRLDLPPAPTPRVLGVDDLALRRHSYATLLVDLETHRPVDLLKERDAETLSKWLKEHPGIEVISRDRSGAYAEGAASGAPSTVQVADRFHLLQNASEALDGMLRGRRLDIEEAEPQEDATTEESCEVHPVEEPVQPERPLSATKRYQAERREARRARWEKVRALREAGIGIRQIARDMGMSRQTVRKMIATPVPPRYRPRPPRSGGLSSPTLAPYVDYLQDRWQQGCTNVAQLFREIQAKGYPGSRSLLCQAVQPWRGPPKPKPPKKERKRARQMTKRLSMRWLCLKPPEKLKADEAVLVKKLLARDGALALGYDLLQRFRELLRDRNLASLECWLWDAAESDIPTYIALANGIKADWAAVEGAFKLPWSNGMLEGHVNRVKLIKRQGYGRAKFDLLRLRVLAA